MVLHTELERKLPKMVMDKIDKSELIEYPNDTKCKLGFFDSIIRRWFGNPFSDDGKLKVRLEHVYISGLVFWKKKYLIGEPFI